MESSKSIAIIGAGPSGLLLMAAFSQLRKQGHDLPKITVYERASEPYGLWNFNWRTGIDQDGQPVHQSMYRNLWTNGPKEDLEFPDYPCEKHWGGVTTSFPPREALRDYMRGYMEFHGVDLNSINYQHLVKDVSFKDERFHVHVYDGKG